MDARGRPPTWLYQQFNLLACVHYFIVEGLGGGLHCVTNSHCKMPTRQQLHAPSNDYFNTITEYRVAHGTLRGTLHNSHRIVR